LRIFLVHAAALASLAASACTLPFDEGVPGCEPFADDFEDGAQAAFWQPNSFETPPASVDESGGELVITLASEPGAFAAYLSDDLDFTNRSVRVRALEMPSAATNAQGFLKVELPFPDTAMLIVEQGILRARLVVGDVTDDLASTPYDPETHRVFRLRHRDGTLHFETSADGSGFSTLASTSIDVSYTRVGLMAGTYQTETAPGRARFDDLAVGCR
jgi:hypothetical protein